MSSAFSRDMYRYFGTTKPPLRSLWREREQLLYLRRFRRAQAAKNPVLRLINRLLLSRASRRTLIQFPPECLIAPGIRLGHLGPVVVNSGAQIGKNCNIASGVTIGASNRGHKKGAPVLAERVWVGANAVIVGNISIGEDVLIAPNAYVNFDVPAHSVVVGNPAVVHSREKATEGYVENLV